MKHEMKMPDLATTGSVMHVVRWRKQPGESVRRGDILFEIETDKSTMDVESTVSGVLVTQAKAPDAEVAGGDVIAVFEVEAIAAPAPAPAPAATPAPAPVAPPTTPVAVPPRAAGGMFARNRAANTNPPPSSTP